MWVCYGTNSCQVWEWPHINRECPTFLEIHPCYYCILRNIIAEWVQAKPTSERDMTHIPRREVERHMRYGIFGGKQEQDLGNNHSESLLLAFLKNSVPNPITLNQQKSLLLRNSRLGIEIQCKVAYQCMEDLSTLSIKVWDFLYMTEKLGQIPCSRMTKQRLPQ